MTVFESCAAAIHSDILKSEFLIFSAPLMHCDTFHRSEVKSLSVMLHLVRIDTLASLGLLY